MVNEKETLLKRLETTCKKQYIHISLRDEMDAPLCNVLNATRAVLAEIGRFPCMQRKSTFRSKMKSNSSSPKQMLSLRDSFGRRVLYYYFFPVVGGGNFALPYIQKSWGRFFLITVFLKSGQIVAFITRVRFLLLVECC